MGSRELTHSAEIRARLNHPIIDSDGHTIEFQPAFLDRLKEVGGTQIVERFNKSRSKVAEWYAASPSQRVEQRLIRPPWWGTTINTLDRVTASVPRLLYERMDEFGLDFTVLYPSPGNGYALIADEELRRATCRAFNVFHADIFQEYRDRMAPVAAIPMHNPSEAIEELQYAVGVLGMKAIVMPSFVVRPRMDKQGQWYDTYCLDSAYDYDPVWAKCLELKVAPTFHSNSQGLGFRNSVSNWMHNQIGHFAASGEGICKAAFFGGVPHRFPGLRMAFLEGGVGWACTLYSDLVSRWKKRNGKSIQNYNPENLDHQRFWELLNHYGGKLVHGRLESESDRNLALYSGYAGLGASKEDAKTLDEFAKCGISKPEDIREMFRNSFYFGCEADDPINAWAFDAKKNPYGARLNAVFSSDIGHWDVPDMADVGAEAYELVEDGLITEDDFRDFVFGNPLKLWTGMNPDFFRGTQIEPYIKDIPQK